jgi:hypothetical protein
VILSFYLKRGHHSRYLHEFTAHSLVFKENLDDQISGDFSIFEIFMIKDYLADFPLLPV